MVKKMRQLADRRSFHIASVALAGMANKLNSGICSALKYLPWFWGGFVMAL